MNITIKPKGHNKKQERDITASTLDDSYVLDWHSRIMNYYAIKDIKKYAADWVREHPASAHDVHLLALRKFDMKKINRLGILITAAYEHEGITRFMHSIDTPELSYLGAEYKGMIINTGNLGTGFGHLGSGFIVNLNPIVSGGLFTDGITLSAYPRYGRSYNKSYLGLLGKIAHRKAGWKLLSTRLIHSTTTRPSPALHSKLEEITTHLDDPMHIPQELIDESLALLRMSTGHVARRRRYI